MATKTSFVIEPHISDILKASIIDGNTLTLTGQLDRKTYQSVMTVIEEIGGKWNRGQKCHVFTKPVADVLSEVLDAGKVERKKVINQSFYTPETIAEQMAFAAGVNDDLTGTVLEPSCGAGNILNVINKFSPRAKVQAYDIDVDAIAVAKDAFPKYEIVENDFLTIDADTQYDRILMNPPFTKGQDIQHVTHALKFLKPNGVLVSIMAGHITRENANSKMKVLLNDVCSGMTVSIVHIAAGEFKESGTNVSTSMLVIRK